MHTDACVRFCVRVHVSGAVPHSPLPGLGSGLCRGRGRAGQCDIAWCAPGLWAVAVAAAKPGGSWDLGGHSQHEGDHHTAPAGDFLLNSVVKVLEKGMFRFGAPDSKVSAHVIE